MRLPHRFKKWFIRQKIYYDRARQYSGVVQFSASIATLVLVAFGDHLPHLINAHKSGFLLVSLLVVIGAHLGLGRLEHKLGLHHEENKRNSEINPITMDIIERLKRIEDKL